MSYNQLPLGLTEEVPNTNKTETYKLRKNKQLPLAATELIENTLDPTMSPFIFNFKSFRRQPPGFKFIDSLCSVD